MGARTRDPWSTGRGRCQDRNREALRHAQLAYDFYATAGHRAGQAHALNNIGWCHALLGDQRQGVDYCERSLALHRELGVGDVHRDAGAARQTWQAALEMLDELGHYDAGDVRLRLAVLKPGPRKE